MSLIKQLNAVYTQTQIPDEIVRNLLTPEWVQGKDFTRALLNNWAGCGCLVMGPDGKMVYGWTYGWHMWWHDLSYLHGAYANHWFILRRNYRRGSKPYVFA